MNVECDSLVYGMLTRDLGSEIITYSNPEAGGLVVQLVLKKANADSHVDGKNDSDAVCLEQLRHDRLASIQVISIPCAVFRPLSRPRSPSIIIPSMFTEYKSSGTTLSFKFVDLASRLFHDLYRLQSKHQSATVDAVVSYVTFYYSKKDASARYREFVLFFMSKVFNLTVQ
jgi:hypothetical protein